jgi:CubicO group peptidase (beta-lactamase class C family)
MKNLTVIFALLFLFSTCRDPQVMVDPSVSITAIENNLLPGLIVEGEDMPPMNIHERMAFYNVPGLSLAFFENGDIQWTRTYGYLSSDSLQAVNEETLFQAASISKPVAATGLLKMVQDGKLDLDTDVNAYLKEWKVPDNDFTREEKVTLRRLLAHNAGLNVHGFRGYAADEEAPGTTQILQGAEPANSDPIVPDTFPGALWRYSGGGYTVMQKVVEDFTGRSYPRVLAETVLAPMGMKRSAFQQPLPESMSDNAAIGHRGDGNKVKGDWHTYPEMAAAGLWTTPSDLARWAISIQKAYNGGTGEPLSPATTRTMLTRQKNDQGLGPGLSGEADSLAFSHGGANEGFRCYLFAFAKNGGQGVVIMTNGDRGSALSMEYLRSISRAYDWGRFEPMVKKTLPLSMEEKRQFAGAYRANEQLELRIYLEEDQIKAAQSWDQSDILLLPEAKDRLFDREDGTVLEFSRDENGEITKFLVQGYEFQKVGE